MTTINHVVTEPGLELWTLPRLHVRIPIVGVTPLIPGKFGEKAKSMMREKQQGRGVKTRKDPKVPLQEAEERTYRLDDGTMAMPAVNFKAALVDGARYLDGITMTNLQRALYVSGDGKDQLVAITGEAELREDFVRNATGVPDIRYRYSIFPWAAVLDITVRGIHLDAEALVNLADAAGIGGIGEWRPSKAKSGIYGTFEVDRTRQVEFLP